MESGSCCLCRGIVATKTCDPPVPFPTISLPSTVTFAAIMLPVFCWGENVLLNVMLPGFAHGTCPLYCNYVQTGGKCNIVPGQPGVAAETWQQLAAVQDKDVPMDIRWLGTLRYLIAVWDGNELNVAVAVHFRACCEVSNIF